METVITDESIARQSPEAQAIIRELMAFTALLMAYYRQSKRRTAQFLSTLLGQPCSAALTVKMQTQVTAAVRPACGMLHNTLDV